MQAEMLANVGGSSSEPSVLETQRQQGMEKEGWGSH